MVIVFCVLINQGCRKDFLDKKPDKALVVPRSLEHFQALLDNGYELLTGIWIFDTFSGW